jgi:hypothetical protein
MRLLRLCLQCSLHKEETAAFTSGTAKVCTLLYIYLTTIARGQTKKPPPLHAMAVARSSYALALLPPVATIHQGSPAPIKKARRNTRAGLVDKFGFNKKVNTSHPTGFGAPSEARPAAMERSRHTHPTNPRQSHASRNTGPHRSDTDIQISPFSAEAQISWIPGHPFSGRAGG